MQIKWIKPSDQFPPFGEQIMVMLGGTGSNNAGRTYEKYVRIMNAVISHRSPNDDEDGVEQEAFFSGPQDDYEDYQFMVYPYDEYKFGFGDNEDSDWFSDSIIAWAPMPDISEIEQRIEAALGGK